MLKESRLALVRDIHQQSKNKVAAQNCHKRKLKTLVQLERELERLGSERGRRLGARGEAERTPEVIRQQSAELYHDIFQYLRANLATGTHQRNILQQAADRAIFLVPLGTKMEATD